MAAHSITVHTTRRKESTARSERAWLTCPSNMRQKSYHIVVDEDEAIECVPLGEAAWHANDGVMGLGNRGSIAIVLCESGDYDRTLANAAELVAKLLKERGWGTERLRRQYDWCGRVNPRLMFDGGRWTGWTLFKRQVAIVLAGGDNR